MANRLKLNQDPSSVPATVSGPKPGDFPLGSIRSRAAARALLANYAAEQAQDQATEFANLTPYERAIVENEDPEIVHALLGLARMAELRAEAFRFSLETPEEIRHLKRVAKLANEMTEGKYREISLADPAEGKRIRDLAEEKFRVQTSSSPTRTSTG
jgi:hypothetical protein